MKKKKDKLISGDTKKILQRDFARLEEPVTILLFTSENENMPFNEYSHNLLVELSEISEKIRPPQAVSACDDFVDAGSVQNVLGQQNRRRRGIR